MILLYIYLGISAITFALHWLTAYEADREFKRRYPHIKAPKCSIIEKIGVVFKSALTSLIPILNICFIYMFLFKSEELEERVIAKVYAKYSKEY